MCAPKPHPSTLHPHLCAAWWWSPLSLPAPRSVPLSTLDKDQWILYSRRISILVFTLPLCLLSDYTDTPPPRNLDFFNCHPVHPTRQPSHSRAQKPSLLAANKGSLIPARRRQRQVGICGLYVTVRLFKCSACLAEPAPRKPQEACSSSHRSGNRYFSPFLRHTRNTFAIQIPLEKTPGPGLSQAEMWSGWAGVWWKTEDIMKLDAP